MTTLRYTNNLVYFEEYMRYNTYNSLFEAVKNGIINEILLNINLAGCYYGKTYYTSTEYFNSISASLNMDSLMKIVKNHHIIREEFLGKIGSMYKNIGYKLSLNTINTAKL